MKNREVLDNEKGFTLVEVLVAMAIFPLVLLTLFSSFDAFMASSRIIKDRQTSGLAAEPGLKIMAADLMQVLAPQVPQYVKPDLRGDSYDRQDRFRFFAGETSAGGKQFSTLSFTSLSPIQLTRPLQGQKPGVTRITYYVHVNDDRLDLHRADRPLFLDGDKMNTMPCTDPVLIRDIHSFDLIYYDAKEEYTVWDSEDETFEYALPARVTIRIGLKGDDQDIETSVLIPITRRVLQ
jgi:general secretion pathway protein J